MKGEGTMDSAEQIAALRQRMVATQVDLVALSPSANMEWVVGLRPAYTERLCLLLVSRTGVAFVMPALDAEHCSTLTNLPFHILNDAAPVTAVVADALRGLDVNPHGLVAIDETMRADHALILIDALPQARRQSSLALMSALRIRKSAAEIAALKAIGALNDRAMQAAFGAIREGASEREVLNAAEASFAAEGATLLYQVVAAGENGAFPHHLTGSRTLRRGDAIVIDLAGCKDGHFSDMTRMAVLGEKPRGYDEIHELVDRAVTAAVAKARPGVRASEVDAAARSIISDAGYGDYFVHRTGHGVGREVHEPPFITATSDTVIEDGMVFTIEPGIYLPGRFGIRLEEIVIVGGDRTEVMSSLPRQVHLI